MSQRLQDKVVLVTGGGTGIGLGITKCCAKEGAAVVIAQINPEVAEPEAAALRAAGHRVIVAPCDIRSREQVKAAIATAVSEFGKLDVLVNNAALTGAPAEGRAFLNETDEHWQRMLDVNLTGTFICMHEAAKQMVAQGHGGSIITISSVGQYAAQEHAAAYCASKAALDGLTKSVAIELGIHGIRVNNVAPGDIDTKASHDVVERAAERGATGKFFRYTPLDRRGKPEEIGAVVAFLASDEASFVTGATWLVDGGFLSY